MPGSHLASTGYWPEYWASSVLALTMAEVALAVSITVVAVD